MNSHTRYIDDFNEMHGCQFWKTVARVNCNYRPADINDKENSALLQPKKRLLTKQHFCEGGPAKAKNPTLKFSSL